MYMYVRVFNSKNEQFNYYVMDASVTTVKDIQDIYNKETARGCYIEIEYMTKVE